MKDVFSVIHNRASVRDFTGEPVPKEYLRVIAESGRHAPTGCNTQTRRLTVVANPDLVAELCAAMETHLDRDEPYDMYRPAAIIIASDDRDDVNASLNCAVAMENMLLAAHALGVGAVWINQLRLLQDCADVRAVLDKFGVPATHNALCNVALGMPVAPVEQRAKEEMRIDWVE